MKLDLFQFLSIYGKGRVRVLSLPLSNSLFIVERFMTEHKTLLQPKLLVLKDSFQRGNFNYLRIVESLFNRKLKPDIIVKYNEMNNCFKFI